MKNTEKETVIEQISECITGTIKFLQKDIPYKTKDIIPSKIWDAASTYDHREFGRILSMLVKQERVGLRSIGTTGANHKQYMLN